MEMNELQRLLEDAGVEIYQVKEGELEIAERVRYHMMDSGLRIRMDEQLALIFSVRSQQSDRPSASSETLFSAVRDKVSADTTARGYQEVASERVEAKDPMDASRVLDVWHEITFAKTFPKSNDSVPSLIEDVRWALSIEKYVTAS